jgi:hypothetical protein
MTQEIIDSEEYANALQIIRSIKEVPNPAYKKAMRDRKAFSPQPGSIYVSNQPTHPSLAEQIQQREKRNTIQILNKITDICDCCPDCSDCTFAMEMQALDRCHRVKRNLVYIGVIEK